MDSNLPYWFHGVSKTNSNLNKNVFKFKIKIILIVLPFLWMVPWILVKRFKDNLWCWQLESDFNLILKIPHSLLLVANVFCAVFIIRMLYSKMKYRNISFEKIKKYR